ncbi:hypothetical protein V493_02968, partial [Pseudogymnoascus sp. VKM F-4281 (FW-2241)]
GLGASEDGLGGSGWPSVGFGASEDGLGGDGTIVRLNIGMGDAVGLGHDDGVGVGDRDNDGGVGRDRGGVSHRAGGGGVDLGGLVGGGLGRCVVNNGSWDLGNDRGVRGLGDGHRDAADGRGDGVWARNGRRDVVDLSHWHGGWLGGNDVGDGGRDLDRDDRGRRVDLGDDLAGLGDGLGDWAQRGGVLGLNRSGGNSRVGQLDSDWDSGLDHIRGSRGRGVCDGLGGAILSPGKLAIRNIGGGVIGHGARRVVLLMWPATFEDLARHNRDGESRKSESGLHVDDLLGQLLERRRSF